MGGRSLPHETKPDSNSSSLKGSTDTFFNLALLWDDKINWTISSVPFISNQNQINAVSHTCVHYKNVKKIKSNVNIILSGTF